MFHVELKTFVCNIVTNYYNCIDYISFISYNILDLIYLLILRQNVMLATEQRAARRRERKDADT